VNEALDQLSDEELAAYAWAKEWYCKIARPKQIMPAGDWTKALILSGRGWGKTLVGGYWIGIEAWRRPETIGHVIAPTWGDVVGTCFEGPSGILSHMPPEIIASWVSTPPMCELTLKNGSRLRGFSAEKPDRLRGPQAHFMWCDEFAAWQYLEETYSRAMFGLRLGEQGKLVATTTPRPKPLIVSLIRESEQPGARTILIRGSTYENKANLAQNAIEELLKYEGTILGRQEIHGEVIDPEEQGIIKKSWFKLWSSGKPLPVFRYIVLSLDTAFTEAARDKKTGDRDPTAGTVWGIFEHPDQPGRDCVMLLDAWEDYLGFPDLLTKVREELQVTYGEKQEPVIKSPFGRPALAIAGGRKPDILIIEEKGSGISLKQALARESIEAYGYNPGKASKLERLHAVAHFFANGIVWIPESPKRPEKPVTWAEDMIQQLCTFSGEGSIKHDDYVDSATQAIRFLTDKHWVTLKPREIRDPAVEVYRPPRHNRYKG